MAGELTLDFDPKSPEGKRLKAIFGVDGEELRVRAHALARAAQGEYRLWVTGEVNPAAITEQRQLRLRLLFEHLPAGEPTDAQIAKLFRISTSRVPTFVANMRATYGDLLDEKDREAAEDLLKNRSSRLNDDAVRVQLDPSQARYLKDMVDQTNAPPIKKSESASRTYEIGRDTIVALAGRLGFDPKEVDAIGWEDS